MKELKDGVTTLFVVFVVCKIVNFRNMTWLDYILCVLLIAYLIILIVDTFRRKKHAKG